MIMAVSPITTVKTIIASKPYLSIAETVSLLLAMKTIPPAVKQKDATISVGGLVGKYELGGFIQKVT